MPPPRSVAGGDAPPSDAGGAAELTFCVGDLPELREFAAIHARRAGMREDRIGDFLVAVNEVATNAVTHGAAKARLRMWADGGDLLVHVHDDGHWIPSEPAGRSAPHDHSTSGMGLWVATELSKSIRFRFGTTGTIVMMRFSL